MANAVQKISLNPSRDIPFNKLVLSQSNVRRTKTGVSIDELAEDIAHRGLLQSLHVRPVLDTEGAETGMFEIPAGGRRYRALQLLVKAKRMAKTQFVPCIVKTDGIAEEDSLAENVQRVALHPLDQFRAFQELREKGLGEEEIAARFFVTPAVVKQRLRLASVSPKLLDVYAEDHMTLEQLMAFTVSDDHKRQEQVWKNLSSWDSQPWTIRRKLTEGLVAASDRRAVFVGVDAYEQAGGIVQRDLFTEDRGGWFTDPGLLDKLVSEKLRTEADRIAAEGWKWIEAAVSFPYGHDDGLDRIPGEQPELTAEEQTTIAALKAEYDQLLTEHDNGEDLPEAVDQRLGEIETALDTIENPPVNFDPADIPRAGVFLSVGSEGELVVERGYVRVEDEVEPDGETHDGVTAERGRPGAIVTVAGEQGGDDEAEEDDGIRPLPDRLIIELTAHRTLALRDAVASNPHVALTALLHRVCLDAFFGDKPGGCLEASVRRVSFPVQMPDLKESVAACAIAERHNAWKADMPQEEEALWNWLAALDDASRAALLAHCVSFGVNALYERGNRYGAGPSPHAVTSRLRQADRLSRAVGLDMAEAGWRPTAANYLGRVTKARILEAVREAKGEAAAQLIDHLKKDEMAREAERLLDGSGWLPEPLRLADDAGTGASDEALPDFLVGDDDEDDDTAADAEDEPVPAVAAE